MNVDKLIQAARCWARRQQGLERPRGATRNGCWVPSTTERQKCCATVVFPSQWQYHCATTLHIAHLFDLHPSKEPSAWWIDVTAGLLATYSGQEEAMHAILTSIFALERLALRELTTREVREYAEQYMEREYAA